MPVYLQRVRFSVHTKKEAFAGTNSPVKLCYKIEEKHNHPKLEPGIHETLLDHPWHDDFKTGKADSYEVNFGVGRVGKNFMGRPMLNGLQFETLEDARELIFQLKIEGKDQWIFDRYAMAGFFMEVRPVAGSDEEYEEVEIGWVEMAKYSGDIEMSTDPNEGYEEFPIDLNGSFE
jgi:hypothetical protein